MSLKRQDGTFESKPTNYERDSHTVGTNFKLSDKTQIFAPHSYLSHARMTGEEEIAIHYPFGVVCVKGAHLNAIFCGIKSHDLAWVSCDNGERAQTNEPRVQNIFFEESKGHEDFG
jgi:hypothetical protein